MANKPKKLVKAREEIHKARAMENEWQKRFYAMRDQRDLLKKQKQMEWISVEDRMPKLVKTDNHDTEPMLESNKVITFSNGSVAIDTAYKIGNGKTSFYRRPETSHWMPLPLPPVSVQHETTEPNEQDVVLD